MEAPAVGPAGLDEPSGRHAPGGGQPNAVSSVRPGERAIGDHRGHAARSGRAGPREPGHLRRCRRLASTAGGQTRRPGGALALHEADYLADFESNLLVAVRLDRALAPAMIEQRSGAIVHVGSAAGRSSRRHPLGYVAAKAALSAYCKGMASELGPYGFRVNVVQPGLSAPSGWASAWPSSPPVRASHLSTT